MEKDDMDEDHLLEQFDRLVEQGVLVYNPNYRTVAQSDQGFSFEFRILDSLTTKPLIPRDPEKHGFVAQAGCAPGSDINVSGYEVATIKSTHLLAFNKFPAARPHFLVLTQDGFKRQYEALDIDDITAALHVLSSFKTRQVLFFNCGVNSGCSRMHKHMQVFPAPDPEQFPLWPDLKESKPPFKYFVRRSHPNTGPPAAKAIAAAYQTLLRRAAEAVGHVGHVALEGEAALPHNLIMTRDWLVVVPRRAVSWEGAGSSAPGMLGMVWVHNEETVKLWLEKGPAKILSRVGFPADEVEARPPSEE